MIPSKTWIILIKLTVNLQSTLFNVANCSLVAWNVSFALNFIDLSLSLLVSQLLWLLLASWQSQIPISSLCTYQCFLPMGGERAYRGAIDIFQNNLSIIPTVGWNSHIKCPTHGMETFSVWNVCMPLLNCWCLISGFSVWQLSRSGEEPSAVLHIHQEKTQMMEDNFSSINSWK